MLAENCLGRQKARRGRADKCEGMTAEYFFNLKLRM